MDIAIPTFAPSMLASSSTMHHHNKKAKPAQQSTEYLGIPFTMTLLNHVSCVEIAETISRHSSASAFFIQFKFKLSICVFKPTP